MLVKYPVLYIFNFPYTGFVEATQRLNCSLKSIVDQVDEIYILNASEYNLKHHILKSEKINVINKPYKKYHNKSLLINYVVKNFLSMYQYYIASDIDLVYPDDYVQSLIKHVKNKPVRVVPKNQVMNHEYYSSNYYELLDISSKIPQHPTGESRGNGLIHVPSFMSIHGYDEKYLGYAPEDLDFNLRVSKLTEYIFDNNIIHIHLWHPNVNREYEKSNDLIFLESRVDIENGNIIRNPNKWGEY